jgi:hypothetical protein
LDAKIEEQTRPFTTEIERLDAIPGVDHRGAEVLLAEVGPDMKPFPSAGLIVYRLLSLIFMAMGAPQAHAKLGRHIRKQVPGLLVLTIPALSNVANTPLGIRARSSFCKPPPLAHC